MAKNWTKIPGTPEQVANRREWVDALRSGKYRQGAGSLNFRGNFCCLGVACELHRDELTPKESENGAVYYNFPDGSSEFTLPTIEFMERTFGIKDRGDIPGAFFESVEGRQIAETWPGYEIEAAGDTLWRLNDSVGLSFATIADVIEAVWECGMASSPTDATIQPAAE